MHMLAKGRTTMADKNPPKGPRIAPRDAAFKASQYYLEVTNSPVQPSIEEIELSEDERFWMLTLGYEEGPFGGHKAYKVFKIDAYTGEVLSMKMR